MYLYTYDAVDGMTVNQRDAYVSSVSICLSRVISHNLGLDWAILSALIQLIGATLSKVGYFHGAVYDRNWAFVVSRLPVHCYQRFRRAYPLARSVMLFLSKW